MIAEGLLCATGDWSASSWINVLMLRDYNTRVVVVGATLLGLGAGVVGSFTLMRKRALVGDALSHATLPGIAIAFLLATALGLDGKSLPLLLLGAAVTGSLGVATIQLIRSTTRLKEDTALGLVLSVFFGAGVALLGIVQNSPTGNAAGLESFIYGKTASMLASDAMLIAIASVSCIIVSWAVFKEMALLCFDAGFASSSGYPVGWLDLLLMAMVVVITIIGLQAVGLVLMIALLVIPPAAARFWTEDLRTMTRLAAAFGAISCYLGAVLSAVYPKLPSGATIVLVAAALFLLSALAGWKRGVAIRAIRRRRFLRRISMEHLLRSAYEITESREDHTAPIKRLLAKRSWTSKELRRLIERAKSKEYVRRENGDAIRLTNRGQLKAEWLTRQHRLWELYLITHADVAPSRVDRGADDIEHVLEPETIHQLEKLLRNEDRIAPPESPHAIEEATS